VIMNVFLPDPQGYRRSADVVQDPGAWMQDASSMGPGSRILDPGSWIQDPLRLHVFVNVCACVCVCVCLRVSLRERCANLRIEVA
jgi:hypothetical protein